MLLVPRPVVADAEMTTRSPAAGTRPPAQLPGVDHELFAPPPIQCASPRSRAIAASISSESASAKTVSRPREGWSGCRASHGGHYLASGRAARSPPVSGGNVASRPTHDRGILRATDGLSLESLPLTMRCRAARLAALAGLSSLLIGVIRDDTGRGARSAQVDRAIRLRCVGHARRAAGLLGERGRAHARRLSLDRHGGRARPLRWRAVHADRSRGAFPISGRKSSRC